LVFGSNDPSALSSLDGFQTPIRLNIDRSDLRLCVFFYLPAPVTVIEGLAMH
jgi:hypothetical protein